MKIILILVLLFVLSFHQVIISQENIWTKIGSTFDAQIGDFIIDSNKTILVGTTETVPTGIPGTGFWRSTDIGKTWTPLYGGFQGKSVYSMLSYTQNEIIAATDKGIYYTSDKGLHWTHKGSDSIFKNLTISPKRTLFALNSHYRLCRSFDLGKNWELVPGLDQKKEVVSFSFRKNGELIVSLRDTCFYRSKDDGNSWERTPISISEQYYVFSIKTYGDDLLAYTTTVGLYRSSDNGKSWEQTTFPEKNISDVQTDAKGNLYITTYKPKGLFLSSDSGITWKNLGCANFQISHITRMNNELFARGDLHEGTSILHSTDGGESWKVLAIYFREITSLNTNGRGTLYVGTDFYGAVQSSDMGEHWSALNSDAYAIKAIAGKPNGAIVIGYNVGCLGSTDSGKTWSNLYSKGIIDSCPSVVYATSDGRFYASGFNYSSKEFKDRKGLYFSDDNGNSWNPIVIYDSTLETRRANAPIENKSLDITAFKVDNNDNLFVAINKYHPILYKSSDKGITWKPLNRSLDKYFDYGIDNIEFGKNDEVFLSSSIAGFARSTDGGVTFDLVINGILKKRIEKLQVIPNGGLLAATHQGIYYLAQGASTWQVVAFTNKITTSLLIAGDYLFTGVGMYKDSVQGLFRCSLNDFIASLPRTPTDSDWWVETGKIEIPYVHDFSNFSIDKHGHFYIQESRLGLYRSNDEGKSWEECLLPSDSMNTSHFHKMLSGNDILGYDFDSTGNTLYILGPDSLYKSVDDGKTIVGISKPLHLEKKRWEGYTEASISVVNSKVIYLGVATPKLNEIYMNETIIDMKGQQFLESGFMNAGMVHRSFDGGITWSQSKYGLPPLSDAFLFLPNGTVFIGTHEGVYRSLDSGYTWKAVNNGIFQKGAFYMDNICADAERTVYYIKLGNNGEIIAKVGYWVFVTKDNGENWTGLKITETFIQPQYTINHESVAITDDGVVLSTDNGKSWKPINTGLTRTDLLDLKLSPNGNIYAVSREGYMFKSIKKFGKK